jgi:PKD repeat protein
VTDTKVAITKPRVNLDRVIDSLGTNPVLNFVSATVVGGNGNQTVDPNECNDLRVVVRNDGPSVATNVSATLTTATPGVSVVQQGSTYPNVAPGATGTNAVNFRITTSPSITCGTLIELTIILTHAGGTNTNTFSLPVGNAGYVITSSNGVSITPGTTDIGNHGDQVLTTVSLPFPCTFYGQVFSSVIVSSDGNLQFSSAEDVFENVCLPAPGFSDAIFAFWDDLRTDGTEGVAQGIYISTNGVAPNRVFNIEWRASYYHQGRKGAPVNFEVRLYENLSRFDLVYGTLNGNGASATAGAQKSSGGPFTQFECNTGGLSNGLQLAFQTLCPDGGGGCSAPIANFIGTPTNGAAPLLVSFTNLSSGASSYSWNFGDGKTSSAGNPVNTYTNAGSYTVTLTAIGAGGTGTLTRTSYIVVTSSPPPIIAGFVANTTNGLAPLTVTFTNVSTGAVSYAWNFGDGKTSTATNPVNTYTNPGSYTVRLTAINGAVSNSLTRTNYIVVSAAPPVANFAGSPTSGVAPLAVSFTNLSIGATSYSWDFGDGKTSAAIHPANIYTNAGSYAVKLTAAGPGGTNILTRSNYIVVIAPAQLVVTPANLNFGLIATGTTAQAAMVISNAGSAVLNGTAAITGGPFTILSGAAYNLGQAGATNLVVEFAPTTAGSFSNLVVFTSTGGASSNVVVGRAATAPVIILLTLSGSEFAFSFETVAGLGYAVEYKDSLNDPAWQTLQSVAGDGTRKTVTNSVSATARRFYQLRVE